MKKRRFSKAIFRFFQKLGWYYDSLTRGPVRIKVDLGKKYRCS